MIKKIGGTEVRVQVGRIEDMKVDGMVNWAYYGMRSGPPEFYRLHRKAGPSLFDHTIGVEEVMRECDCVSTMPGLLDCSIVFHSVIPDTEEKMIRTFYNLYQTINKYKQDNLLEDLALTAAPGNSTYFAQGIKDIATGCSIKTITIVADTPAEAESLKENLEKYTNKKNLWGSLEEKIWEAMARIGRVEVVSPSSTVGKWILRLMTR